MKGIECYSTSELLKTIEKMGFKTEKRVKHQIYCKLNSLVVCVYNTGKVVFQGKGAEDLKYRLIQKINEINGGCLGTS